MSAQILRAARMSEYIWLGELEDSNDVAWLRETGIRRVLRFRDTLGGCCRSDDDKEYMERPPHVRIHYTRHGIQETIIDLDDNHRDSMLMYLAGTTQVITDAVDAREPILVHCNAGMSRSPAAIIAYMIALDIQAGAGWGSPEAAVEEHRLAVQAKRPIVAPSPVFLRDLVAWTKQRLP